MVFTTLANVVKTCANEPESQPAAKPAQPDGRRDTAVHWRRRTGVSDKAREQT